MRERLAFRRSVEMLPRFGPIMPRLQTIFASVDDGDQEILRFARDYGSINFVFGYNVSSSSSGRQWPVAILVVEHPFLFR